MKKLLSVFLLFTMILSSLSLPVNAKIQGKTQLQVREYQTRYYDTQDNKMVLKALINTLQDEGYILNNINSELGVLTASKEFEIRKKTAWGTIGNGFGTLLGISLTISTFGICIPIPIFYASRLIKGSKATLKIESTINISDFDKQIKVRANFSDRVNETAKRYKVLKVDDQKFYQEFFSKVDKGIFIQKENI
jgi:cell division protein FtsB